MGAEAGAATPAAETPKEKEAKEQASLNLFKQQLEEAKAKQAKASKDEDFAAAKKYKDRAVVLEAELKRMEGGKNNGGVAKKASELKAKIEDVKTKKAKASEE